MRVFVCARARLADDLFLGPGVCCLRHAHIEHELSCVCVYTCVCVCV